MNAMFNRWSCWILVWLWGLTAVACQPTIEPALTPDGSTPTPLTNQEIITPISSLPTKVLTPTIPLSPTLSISPTAPLPPTETSTLAPTPTPVPSATPILLTDPGRILYMEAPESTDFGYSADGHGFIYSLTLNEKGEPINEPFLLSGETPVMWGRLVKSPDSSRIVILGNSEAGDVIFTLYPDTGKVTHVIGPVHFFDWYPNNRQILLWGDTLGLDTGLWLQNIDTDEHIALLEKNFLYSEQLGSVGSSTASPDGQTIMYTERKGDTRPLWLINPDGSNRRLLTETGFAANLAWSPNGQMVAFVGDADGKGGVVVINADGSNRHIVSQAFADGHAFPVTWSPDSQMLAFNGECDSILGIHPSDSTVDASSQPIHFHNNIYLANVITGEDWPLLQDGCGSTDAAWSPDSHYVTFASVRSGHPEIWIAATDGTNLHQLTHYDGALVRYPVWLSNN